MHGLTDDEPPDSETTGDELSDERVTELLDQLGILAGELRAQQAAADRELDAVEAAEEVLLIAGAGLGRAVEVAGLVARREVALATMRELHRARRAVVAWRADLAVYAALTALRPEPVLTARAHAADPGRFYGPDQLAALPPVDDHARAAADHALRLANTGTGPAGADLSELALDAVQRLGLHPRERGDGTFELVQDGDSDSRRRRLWGDVWTDHQLPDLPDRRWLVLQLLGAGVDRPTIIAVRTTNNAADQLRVAADRLDALDLHDPAAEDEGPLHDVLDTAPTSWTPTPTHSPGPCPPCATPGAPALAG